MRMVADGYKGLRVNKELANVKFCDNFSPRLSITAGWKSVSE